jgi:copper oxidase (laccase) domain-containing protein
VSTMNVTPSRILAWLAPAIGPQAFEVGSEVRTAFVARDPMAAQAFVPAAAPGKYLADLYMLARQRLHGGGVDRIYGGGLCTFTDAARFYSFRRDGVCGRMAALIWLQPDASLC